MNHPITGLQYFLDGFTLITKPGIKRFVLIPLLINMLLFTGLFFVLTHFIHAFNAWFAHFLPSWLTWLSGVFWVLFFVCFFIILIYTFVTIGNVVSAPFNSFLAEKVELYLTGNIPEERTLAQNLKDIPRIIWRQLCIAGFYLPWAILFLILFFVPIIQSVAALLWVAFNAWFLTFTYLDYPTDNHRVPVREVRAWMRKRRWVTLGFGGSVLIASMIPGVNFFTIPSAVAGATKFWVEESRRLS